MSRLHWGSLIIGALAWFLIERFLLKRVSA